MVKFAVEIREHAGTYGVTLWVEDQNDPDVTPSYRSVLRGAPGFDLNEMTKLWGDCHQEAMDEVGLTGFMAREDYESKLLASIIRTGDLMARHKYESVGFSTLEEDLVYALFVQSESMDN